MKAINEQIKRHRIARGLNQPQLGKLINKSKGYVSAIESGRIFPSHKTLIEIAEALECELLVVDKLAQKLQYCKHCKTCKVCNRN